MIVRLELARKLKAKNLHIHYDSKLIVNQVKGDYSAKEPNMIAYLEKTNTKLETLFLIQDLQNPEETKL